MLPEVFKVITSGASNVIVTLLSVTVSTDKTVIWYDEWEDGYEENVAFGIGRSTKVWGDGNAANGCAPTILNCTNSMDRLYAGDSFVIQNDVPIPRVKANILYDGGDRIQASFPITVNRAAYAKSPGSVLAGAVEMLDTMAWGMNFEAPVGVDLGRTIFAFELSLFMIMGGYNNTKVFLPDNTTRTINIGETTTFKVNQGHRIRTDKPVQVHLFTGDVNSAYETRWYSIRPIETYSTAYVTPVGDSMGKTKMIVYNPSSTIALNYTFRYVFNNTYLTATGTVAVKQAGWTPVIPTGSGALIEGNIPFVALTVTDSEDLAGDNYNTGGQMYDWGCPVVPRSELTSEVLLGLGYGCTNNNCQGTSFDTMKRMD
jgi:IgGFc binding protein